MAKANKEEQRQAPILRFKGFTDDWEQRKLGDLITEYKKVTTLSSGYSLATSSRRGLFLQKDYFNGLKSGVNDKQLYKILPPNFITYRYMSDDLIFHFNKNSFNKNLLISKEYPVFQSISSKCQNDFLISVLNNKNIFSKFAIKSKKGGTRTRLYLKTLKNFELKLPSIDEQSKIKNIISILEKLLTLYERKTRILSKIRTFLTQRLFSNSSKVSLYFDNKNWSKHKISEFLTERNEKVIPNPSIPLVSFTVEKGVTPKSKRYNREFLVKDDKKKYKITKKNDIVYNPANLKFGAIARNKFGNAAFSPIYVTFITKLNPAFTEFLVRRKDFIKLALKYQEGTVYERMAVKSKDFLNLKIYLPNSSRDIDHIAQILQSLDTLVSLNKNKISLTTLIKKELLNTMFI